jgi:hypothetical protein
VFTARYALSPYIKQITFRLERIKEQRFSTLCRSAVPYESRWMRPAGMFQALKAVSFCV